MPRVGNGQGFESSVPSKDGLHSHEGEKPETPGAPYSKPTGGVGGTGSQLDPGGNRQAQLGGGKH